MRRLSYFDGRQSILEQIRKKGGWVNAHAHLDRAFSLTSGNFSFTGTSLQQKWFLVDTLKRKSAATDIYSRMAYSLERLLSQGVQAVGTFIDVDEIIRDKAIKAAIKLRDRYHRQVKIRFINQVLKGVIDKKAYEWFKVGVQFVDIIGGLPGKDKGQEEKHLDILFNTAQKMKKMLHVHVDQFNTSDEKETELLVKKTDEYKMQGRVVAIHGISIGAHQRLYRKKLYSKMKQAGVAIISCPSAWIDSRRSDKLSPTHNAVTPIDELVPAGVCVALGTDNITDIYKPFSDGDMWTELRFLLETCHFYDISELVEIATTNGLKVLGI